MKTPYMNVKENQALLLVLVMIIAFLLLNCIRGFAQVAHTDIHLFANAQVPALHSVSPSGIVMEQPMALNEAINSHFIELKPVMAPCGNRLYFSRLPYQASILKSKYDEDIWYTDYDSLNTIWSEPKRLAGELNNSGPNFVNSISPKGDTLVLGNRYAKKGKMFAGLSYSVKVNGEWSFPQTINIRNDYNTSEHANHYVSFQHHVIISAIERAETVGQRDLYVSFWNGGTATEPMNLGFAINTELEESSPYLSSDGKTLYFASQGHGGYGGFDIYMTTRLDDTWTNWSPPVNLGPAINTATDEEHFSLTQCGRFGLFSRQMDNSNVDLFRVSFDAGKFQQPVRQSPNSFASL